MDRSSLVTGIRDVLAQLHDVTAEELREALDPEPQEGDAFAGIVIVPLRRPGVMADDGQIYHFYGARVYPGRHVNPHYHRRGAEPYVIRRGAGLMHLGVPTADQTDVQTWLHPFPLGVGPGEENEVIVDVLEVHSLENAGDGPIDFAFACPKMHLDRDRVFTTEWPNGRPRYQR
jgi:mannose-6-phosphate isomerase-like protein (cupin superfamily)